MLECKQDKEAQGKPGVTKKDEIKEEIKTPSSRKQGWRFAHESRRNTNVNRLRKFSGLSLRRFKHETNVVSYMQAFEDTSPYNKMQRKILNLLTLVYKGQNKISWIVGEKHENRSSSIK